MVIFVVQLNANSNNTDIYGLLNEAFVRDKDEILDTIFIRWKTESVPISKKELSQFPRKEKLTYQLFKKFYSPIIDVEDLPKDIKKSYSNPDSLEQYVPYRLPKYIVVQSNIRIGFVESFSEIVNINEHEIESYLEQSETIINFKPAIKIKDKTILFQNSGYETGIYNFVITDNKCDNIDDEKCFKMKYNERLKRSLFLQDYIGTLFGHWGGLHTITLPQVNFIVYNKNMRLALIYYRDTWFSGGEAMYFRVGQKWMKIYKRNTWME